MRPVVAVVLAAGASRRFGENKLLASLDGVPVIRRTVQNVLDSPVRAVHVVLGRDAGLVRLALAGLPVDFVHNADYRSGMSTSLRAGVEAARIDGDFGLLVALGDQPSVTPAIIGRIIESYRRSRVAIVAPVYRGIRGNPVLFDAEIVSELLDVRGDEGARQVIARDSGRVEPVAFDSLPPPDVDTPSELAALQTDLAREEQPLWAQASRSDDTPEPVG